MQNTDKHGCFHEYKRSFIFAKRPFFAVDNENIYGNLRKSGLGKGQITGGYQMRKILTAVTGMILAGTLTISPLTIHAEGNPYGGGWNNCTWSAWQLVSETDGIQLPQWGNAGSWLTAAANAGYATGSVPAANSIAVWSHHVAFVTDTDGIDQIYTEEGGFNGGYYEGWFSATGRGRLCGFIYLGDVPSADSAAAETWQ